jgi:hypothetical protein
LNIALSGGPTDRAFCCCSGVALAVVALLLALAVVRKEWDVGPIACAMTGLTIAYDDGDADVGANAHNAIIIDDITLHSINLFLVIYILNLQMKSILNVASNVC